MNIKVMMATVILFASLNAGAAQGVPSAQQSALPRAPIPVKPGIVNVPVNAQPVKGIVNVPVNAKPVKLESPECTKAKKELQKAQSMKCSDQICTTLKEQQTQIWTSAVSQYCN